MRTGLALVAACAMALAASPSLAGEPAARSLAVEHPGWVRVALDGPAQAWGFPGERWVVLDPKGSPVAVAVLRPQVGVVEARTISVQETPAGWQLVFDLGPTPARHETLLLDLAHPVVAEGCLLEGSDDLAAWRPLARAALFRLGEAPGLASGALRHPESTHRFLRLTWPRKAGFPEFRRIRVELLPRPAAPPATLDLELAPADGDVAGQSWRLALPAADLRLQQLALDWGGASPRAVQVLRAEDGRWRPAGAWRSDLGKPTPEAGIQLSGTPLEVPQLRVDARGGEGLRLVSARAELAPRWLLFEAPVAGRYALVSRGAAPVADPPAEKPLAESVIGPVADVPLGPEETAAISAPPAGLSTVGGVTELPQHWRAWPIVAPGARPGDVVQVELSPELLATPGLAATELRPMVQGKLTSFVVMDRLAPAAAVVAPGRLGLRQEGAAWAADWDLPAPATGVRQLELATRTATPFRLQIDLAYRVGRRPGVAPEAERSASVTWDHGLEGEPPFDLLIDLAPPEGAAGINLTARLVAGARPDLSGACFWRVRRSLMLIWPAGGKLQLMSGFGPAVNPPMDRYLDWFAARPARLAAVDLAQAAAESRQLERKARFALIAALVIAGAALVFVLARSLKRGPRGDEP